MYPLQYLVEKFEQAVFDLATGEGDARSRLDLAYGRFWTIPLSDYPESMRKEREEIDRLMTRLPSRSGYVIPDNLRRMKNKTASLICAHVYSICFMLVDMKQAQALVQAERARDLYAPLLSASIRAYIRTA